MLRCLLLTALACSLSLPSWASSLAILPLDRVPTAPDYDGLAYVLSGLFTTDLSQVSALQLVERQRHRLPGSTSSWASSCLLPPDSHYDRTP